MKKLVVMFPGVGYGFNHPLLYYSDLLFDSKGYECFYMRYQDTFFDDKLSFDEKAAKVRRFVFEEAKKIDFTGYDEIVFLSKSIGSVEAGVFAESLDFKVKQIFLTPVEKAIPYCKTNSCVVIGTKDEAFGAYKKHCDESGIEALYIENANHSLEVEGSVFCNLEIIEKVMKYIDKFEVKMDER